MVRASTLVWSERDFVLAAKTMGARNGRIMFREVLPNVAPALVSYSLIVMANLIVVEGAVAFLGLSVASAHPDLGRHDQQGPEQSRYGSPHLPRAGGGDVPHRAGP